MNAFLGYPSDNIKSWMITHKPGPQPKDPTKSYFIYANGAEVEKDIVGEVTSESFDAELDGSPLKKVILGTHVTSIVGPGFEDTAIEEIEIPNTITYFGTAFTNCAYLKKISVPEGIDHIIAGTFSGCVRLANIELPSTLDPNFKPRTIAAGAFENCGSEAAQQVTLICKAVNPPVAASGILGSPFDGMPDTSDKVKIVVPVGSAQAYKDATDGWSYFDSDCFIEEDL